MKEMQVCELDRELTPAWMEIANIKRKWQNLMPDLVISSDGRWINGDAHEAVCPEQSKKEAFPLRRKPDFKASLSAIYFIFFGVQIYSDMESISLIRQKKHFCPISSSLTPFYCHHSP